MTTRSVARQIDEHEAVNAVTAGAAELAIKLLAPSEATATRRRDDPEAFNVEATDVIAIKFAVESGAEIGLKSDARTAVGNEEVVGIDNVSSPAPAAALAAAQVL